MNVSEALAKLTAATRARRAADAARRVAVEAKNEADVRCHEADLTQRAAQDELEKAIEAELSAEVQS